MMKKLNLTGTAKDIQKFFFSKTKAQDFDASKLTQDLINKHSKVMDHKNRSLLRQLLKASHTNGANPQEIKMFH